MSLKVYYWHFPFETDYSCKHYYFVTATSVEEARKTLIEKLGERKSWQCGYVVDHEKPTYKYLTYEEYINNYEPKGSGPVNPGDSFRMDYY